VLSLEEGYPQNLLALLLRSDICCKKIGVVEDQGDYGESGKNNSLVKRGGDVDGKDHPGSNDWNGKRFDRSRCVLA
jgi:hypothetical protein